MWFWGLIAALVAALWIFRASNHDERRERLVTVAVWAGIVAFVAFGAWTQSVDSQPRDPLLAYERASVSRVSVVDATTIAATVDGRPVTVRLIGVEELAFRDPDQRACAGAGTVPALRELLEAQDRVITIEAHRDLIDKDDVLAYVWSDDELVNLTLLARGHLIHDDFSSHPRDSEFRDAGFEGLAKAEARCPFPSTTTTLRAVVREAPRYQQNQYGCHSDARCLDDYDTWCDEGDLVLFEPTDESVCEATLEWLIDLYAEDYLDEYPDYFDP